MKKALITGGSGFVGAHLLRHLVDDLGWTAAATTFPGISFEFPDAEVYGLDILNKDSVLDLLERLRPDYIVNLAAQSSASLSWKDPFTTVDVNIKGVLNILEAVRMSDGNPRILLVGSGEEYGAVDPALNPVGEDTPLCPGNIYAISKICQGHIGKLYSDAYGLDVVSARAFNHIGPGQSPGFAVPDFCLQVAQIEAGKLPPEIMVGNLAAKRDFTDVRDVVRAYSALLQSGVSGQVYNVGSGHSVSIEYVLQEILKLSPVSISIVSDPEKYRPIDTPELTADISKISAACGWSPGIPLGKSLRDVLEEWRSRQ